LGHGSSIHPSIHPSIGPLTAGTDAVERTAKFSVRDPNVSEQIADMSERAVGSPVDSFPGDAE
jgi:hypothetical protein